MCIQHVMNHKNATERNISSRITWRNFDASSPKASKTFNCADNVVLTEYSASKYLSSYLHAVKHHVGQTKNKHDLISRGIVEERRW